MAGFFYFRLLSVVTLVALASETRGQTAVPALEIHTVQRGNRAGQPTVLFSETVLAVNGNGSFARRSQHYAADGSTVRIERVVALSSGSAVRLSEDRNIGVFSRLFSPAIDNLYEAAWNPATQCSLAYDGHSRPGEKIAEETFLGVRTIVFESRFRAAPQVRRWLAPGLGCLELRTIATFLKNGEPAETSENVAIRIRVGEPDPKWFHVPESVVEVSPSEMFARVWGTNVEQKEAKSLQQREEQWQQRRDSKARFLKLLVSEYPR